MVDEILKAGCATCSHARIQHNYGKENCAMTDRDCQLFVAQTDAPAEKPCGNCTHDFVSHVGREGCGFRADGVEMRCACPGFEPAMTWDEIEELQGIVDAPDWEGAGMGQAMKEELCAGCLHGKSSHDRNGCGICGPSCHVPFGEPVPKEMWSLEPTRANREGDSQALPTKPDCVSCGHEKSAHQYLSCKAELSSVPGFTNMCGCQKYVEPQSVQQQVIALIEEREKVGIQRYGTGLMPNNGRSAITDLFEELLDSVMYAHQLRLELEDIVDELLDVSSAIYEHRSTLQDEERLNAVVDQLVIWRDGNKPQITTPPITGLVPPMPKDQCANPDCMHPASYHEAEMFQKDGRLERPHVFVKNNARATSRAAAHDALPKSGTQRRRVFDYIESKGDTGATIDEITNYTGIIMNSVLPRRKELEQAGFIHDSGQRRKTRNGSDAIVWTVTKGKTT